MAGLVVGLFLWGWGPRGGAGGKRPIELCPTKPDQLHIPSVLKVNFLVVPGLTKAILWCKEQLASLCMGLNSAVIHYSLFVVSRSI